MDLLIKKKVISADEAARLKEQSVPGHIGGKGAAAASRWSDRVRFGGDIRLRSEGDRAGKIHPGAIPPAPADQGISALVELLMKKKVISAEEVAHLHMRPAEEKRIVVSEASEKEQLDKLKASVSREIMKSLPEQVKKQVREELRGKEDVAAAEKAQDKEQLGTLNEKVSYVEQKVAELLYGGKVAALAAAAPEQTKRIRFSGDIRLRYESDRFDKHNALFLQPSNPTQIMNTTSTQDRFKYRVRAGMDANIAENLPGNAKLQGAIRLATGNTTNPVSTNTLLGSYLNKDNILVDQAYLKFTWKTEGDPPTVYTVYGGRIPNPWFSSDLVWDPDLNFDGLAAKILQPLTDTGSWAAFVTGGAFPLQYDDLSNKAKWLAGGQAGVERKDLTGVALKLGAAYYSYSNITGVRNDPLNPGLTDWTAPQFQQKGNTLFNISADPTVIKTALASEFRELNLTGTLDVGFWNPYHIVFLGDYVKNLGFKKSDVAQRTGTLNPAEETTGYQVGLSVGRPAIETDFSWSPNWKAFLYYKYLQADAVVDAFTDSDFHLGGTNAKGWILGGEYGLMKNTWLTLRWLTSNEISGPPLRIDVFQVDFNARF
ncbi:MAG TPA: putative porin [Dissulfurispiraceae bacterium]